MKKILLFNKGVMFLLELAAIVALGYWGFHAQRSIVACYLLGIGTPLAAIFLWSIFAAPNSARRLAMPYRGVFTIVFFGGAAVLLYQTEIKNYAIALMIISLIAVTLATMLES